MKQAGLRMKKVEVSNVPAKKEIRVEEFENKTLTLPERNVIAFAKAIKQVKEEFAQSITGIVAPPEKELITPLTLT